jgi:hypothetical protein
MSAVVKATVAQALLAVTPLRRGRMVLILPKVAANPAPAAIPAVIGEMVQRGTPIRRLAKKMVEKAIAERGTAKAPIDYMVDGSAGVGDILQTR